MSALVVRGDAPTRPALRWFGGKWRLAPWIIAHLPPHDAYCEPYGGAASVLLRKPPAKLETWNDLHSRLVNFFRVLRDQPDELVRLLTLTPYAREEYDAARALVDDPLEDARRFVVLASQGRVGAAVIHTRDLFKYARAHSQQTRRAGNGGEEFLYPSWDQLKKELGPNAVLEQAGEVLISTLDDWPAGVAIQEGLF